MHPIRREQSTRLDACRAAWLSVLAAWFSEAWNYGREFVAFITDREVIGAVLASMRKSAAASQTTVHTINPNSL